MHQHHETKKQPTQDTTKFRLRNTYNLFDEVSNVQKICWKSSWYLLYDIQILWEPFTNISNTNGIEDSLK